MANPFRKLDRRSFVWAMYDWANTGYAMIVLALIFPPLYQNFWGKDLAVQKQTFYFTTTVACASVIVAILAPFLGSIAEMRGIRRQLLMRFAIVGMFSSLCIYWIGAGHYIWASIVFIVGTVSFYCGNIFFDSMLSLVSNKDNRGTVSGMGFAFGYSAGLILVLLIGALVKDPQRFGFEDTVSVSRSLFILAGCWWAIFSIPLFMGIKEEPIASNMSVAKQVRLTFKETKNTFLEILKIKPVFWFLVAYLFYIDAVNTIITTASNYGATLGFTEVQLIQAFLCVQIVGIPCALLFGILGDWIGPRIMILGAIVIYVGIVIYGSMIDAEPIHIFGLEVPEMYILATLVGMVQGGIQALSRSYFANIIPEERAVAFFGFYSMIGKSAAILGPSLMALVAVLFHRETDPLFSTRLGFGAIALLFIAGFVCFLKSRESRV